MENQEAGTRVLALAAKRIIVCGSQVESEKGGCVLGPSKKRRRIRHTFALWMGTSDHEAVACTHQG